MLLSDHFLLAIPQVELDYFSSSLIYICDHSEEGALGFVVNKPTDYLVNEFLNQANLRVNKALSTNRVLSGGPVSRNQCFVIHSPESIYEDSKRITNNAYLSSGWDVLRAISEGSGPKEFEIALGYAGWGPGQLESEISKNLWLTAEADTEILFKSDYTDRLQIAASRIGIDLQLLSSKAGYA